MTTMENHTAEATALVQLFTAHDPHVLLTHLDDDDFTNESYQKAFATMRSKIEGGLSIRGDASMAAMLAPIMENHQAHMSSANLVRSLKQLTQRRKLCDAVNKIGSIVTDFDHKPEEILELALHEIELARDSRVTGSKMTTVKEAVEIMHSAFEARVRGESAEVGISVGIPALDELMTVKRGDLVTIGGRTGVGKTAFALTMAMGMAMQGIRVCYLCREMPSQQIIARLVAQLSGENSRNFDRGKMTVAPEQYATAVGKIRKLDDAFVLASPRSLSDAITLANQCRQKHHTTVFFFDYIQQFTVASARTPREATMKVTDALKAFAVDNNVSCIGLAQLNREAASKLGVPIRPRIHHLQESGSIEQDSDIILLLWNPASEDKAILKEEGEPSDIMINCDVLRSKISLDQLNANGHTRCAAFIDKYRGGERFRAVLGFDAPRTLFYPEVKEWS